MPTRAVSLSSRAATAGSSAAILGLSAAHARPRFDLRDAHLQAALVFVGAGITDVLVAVGLGKEKPEADAARSVRGRGIEPLGARNRPAQIDHVLEGRLGGLRARRRRLHDAESAAYSSISGSISASK